MHQQPSPPRAPVFVPLRYKLIVPLLAFILVLASAGAFIIARRLSDGLVISQERLLLQTGQSVFERSSVLYDVQRLEAQRVAFTVGVPEAVQRRDARALQPILETLAQVSQLDAVVVTDTAGREVLGILRSLGDSERRFAVSTSADLSQQAILRSVIDDAYIGATGLLRTPNGVMLFTATPIYLGDETVGVALVGQQLTQVMESLRGSALADLALYGPDGALLQTTWAEDIARESLALPPEVFTQALIADYQLPLQSLSLGAYAYQAVYQPFRFGPQTLGVVGAFMPDHIPFVTESGRQLTALLAAALAGSAVMMVYVGVGRMTARLNRVSGVAAALAAGQVASRTQMPAHDEIGVIGRALDVFADSAQQRQDLLRQSLRRKRREAAHLLSVVEAMPVGVVVQDMDGRVILMNDRARGLLGSQRVFRSAGLYELAAVADEVLGDPLAPGLYALGDPRRVGLDGRMLSAQAAAVISPISEQRLGTVILLRDITEAVRQERDRDAMLERLAEDVHAPLAALGRDAAYHAARYAAEAAAAPYPAAAMPDMMSAFAREISRQAVALQKMIVDLRELAMVDLRSVQRAQRPLRVETLLWAVANEWRQIAQANRITLHLMLAPVGAAQKGVFVLGDEKRLRWALGNLIDNAIKFTPPGGACTLEFKEEQNGQAVLRVRDNGIGIAKEERDLVFMRFYRGSSQTPEGRLLAVPGMGQGLYVAKLIVEAHGGRIWLKSTEGVGTAVYVSLPMTAPVGLEMPDALASVDFEGDTVRLPEAFFVELENRPHD